MADAPVTDWMPTRKVTAATIGSALAGILAWALKEFAVVDVPLEVALFFSTIGTAVAGYWIREP